jgi:hypothetical protein
MKFYVNGLEYLGRPVKIKGRGKEIRYSKKDRQQAF